MPDTLTDAQLDAIEARAAAAMPNEEWAKDRTVCSVVVDDGKTWIVYDDGDHAAQVHGNLGLDIDERAVAEFWAHAMTDIPALIAALRESRERESAYAFALKRIARFENRHGPSDEAQIARAALGEQEAPHA